MVQLLLVRGTRSVCRGPLALSLDDTARITSRPPPAAGSKPKASKEVTVPVFQPEGGRKLVYDGSFSTEQELGIKRGFWNKFVDFVAGPPDQHYMVRPYSVVRTPGIASS